jgi:hypothetical protein
MGIALFVIGTLFLLGGLAISIYEAFKDIIDKGSKIDGRFDGPSTEKITQDVIKSIKDLLEVFAKLTVGIQVSLIGLLLVYWGLLILGRLPTT